VDKPVALQLLHAMLSSSQAGRCMQPWLTLNVQHMCIPHAPHVHPMCTTLGMCQCMLLMAQQDMNPNPEAYT